eukprot:643612-Pleurochrysis_carterae.AAC.1
MVGNRLEMLIKYDMPGGAHEFLWCACEISVASDVENMPRKWEAGKAALVRWDANPHRKEQASQERIKLTTKKWNKGCTRVWSLAL